MPLVELVGVHASLIDRRDVQQEIIDFLRGHPTGRRPGPYFPVLERAAMAWQVPALALSINPAWSEEKQPDVAFGDDGCRTDP
ncbi:hypothetical protein [Micromonospora sp. SL4-19]|uniref:hypothetical protein n=1 Tax=Micromonospora sp. SL4-19 TaxID=3399129 RepID=UPI003A4D2BC1